MFLSKLNLSVLYQVIARLFFNLTFKSVDEILQCYHSDDTSFAELLFRNIYFLRFYQKKLNVLGNILMWELKRNHIRITRDSHI